MYKTETGELRIASTPKTEDFFFLTYSLSLIYHLTRGGRC